MESARRAYDAAGVCQKSYNLIRSRAYFPRHGALAPDEICYNKDASGWKVAGLVGRGQQCPC
jgi:hypothetical protein